MTKVELLFRGLVLYDDLASSINLFLKLGAREDRLVQRTGLIGVQFLRELTQGFGCLWSEVHGKSNYGLGHGAAILCSGCGTAIRTDGYSTRPRAQSIPKRLRGQGRGVQPSPETHDGEGACRGLQPRHV